MTPARLAVLALAALLATGGAFLLSSQRHLDRAVDAGDPVLPQLRGAINDVAEVRLARGDGTSVTLRRGADGWTVVERNWPADPGKVRKLLLDLSALSIVEEKTHDPARYPVLGVEDVASPSATGTRVDVKTTAGAIHSLLVGKPSGAREGFVRAVGAAPSYLARPQVAAEPNPARWLDTALLDIDPARIRSVSLAAAAGAGARELEGAQIPQGLAGALDGLALEDVRPRPLTAARGGNGAPERRARFTTWEGLIVEITGREDGTRRWVSLDSRFDPAAARSRPATPPSPASTAAPMPSTTGGKPATAADSPDPGTEAARLQRRTGAHEFEVPAFRFSSLFDVPG